MLVAFVVVGVLAPFVVLALGRFLEQETATRPTGRPEPEVPSDAGRGDR